MKARVFVARGGNRCITPMYAGATESDAAISGGIPASMFAIMAGIEDTRECVDVEDGQELSNVPVRLTSRGFAHGALDLICIGGPMLDEAQGATAVAAPQAEQETPCPKR